MCDSQNYVLENEHLLTMLMRLGKKAEAGKSLGILRLDSHVLCYSVKEAFMLMAEVWSSSTRTLRKLPCVKLLCFTMM